MPCESGCGLVVPKDELKVIVKSLKSSSNTKPAFEQEHNCVKELRSLVQAQQAKLVEVQAEVAESKFQLQEQKRELQLLKDFMRAMRNANPSMRILADQMEADEVRRWAETLSKARVLRWGGMISTPDTVLQVTQF